MNLEFATFYYSLVALNNNNNFREILKFTNLSSSRKLKPREYYQIYSIHSSHILVIYLYNAVCPEFRSSYLYNYLILLIVLYNKNVGGSVVGLGHNLPTSSPLKN